MKRIVLVGDDSRLRNEYVSMDPECEFDMLRADDHSRLEGLECHILIISDRAIPSLTLSNFVQQVRADQIYYLISSHAKSSIVENKIALCKQHGIKPIHPKQTNAQIVQRILGIAMKHNVLRNVCAVLGTHPQVGTTIVSLNLAHKLSQSDMTVCVLGLNQYNSGSDFFAQHVGCSLDEIYTQLVDQDKHLKSNELMNYLHYDERRRFHYLAGNQDFAKRGLYRSENIEYLISMASSQFDLVILDCGFSPCNNLTLQGLFKSEVKLLVGSQQPLSARLWGQMNQDILRLLGVTSDEFLLVVNRYKYDLPIDAAAIQRMMEVPVMTVIPDFGIEGTICELEKKLFVESKNKHVRKKAETCFDHLAQVISERIQGFSTLRLKEKHGIWNKFLS